MAPARGRCSMAAMVRGFFVACLYLLLLGVQQEGLRHGVAHLRGELAQAHERAIVAPGEPCDECALLAGAAHAVVSVAAAYVTPVAASTAPLVPAHSFTPATARYYAARAPPRLG
jgi:hypothetical protein